MLTNIQGLESTNAKDTTRTTMVIPIRRNMLIKIKQVSAAKHHSSMAEMVRYAVERYMKTEGMM